MDNQTPNKNKWNRYLAGIGVALMTLITTYLVHTNPALNLANLTANPVPPATATQLYMPYYTGGIGESGLLEVKTMQDAMVLDSITFTLNYSPVNALIFENNPIVFDTDTLFQNAAFQMTAAPEDGKLIVTIVLDDPVTTVVANPADPLTHQTLFKLNTQLNDALPVGQVVDVSFSDAAMLNGTNLVTTDTIPATTVTVQGQDELRVLSAESIDSTHIAVEFSDYLSNIGVAGSYSISPAIGITDVTAGEDYGYSQKYVVLTTGAQTAGTEYTLHVDPLSAVASNQQGGVDTVYSYVIAYGYGVGATVLSDFGMSSASVSNYTNITVNFTHPVRAASVTKSDFSLNGGAILIDNVVSISGTQVVLSVSTPLLKNNTYLLNATSPTAILRDSDGAGLGIDRVAFAGSKNGPRLISANVSDAGAGVYRLQLTFDENIQYGGIPNNPVGYLHTTGTAAGTAINSVAPYNQSISGATLTLENAVFNNANANFTYSVSSTSYLKNSLGVGVDSAYKSISFWGLGHNASTNSIGTVEVTQKDAFVIPAGTLNFADVVKDDVTVLYNNGTANLQSQVVESIGMSGSNLVVGMQDSLDPTRHYVVRIVDTLAGNNTLAAKDFAISRALNVSSAQALSSTQVRVLFSENIDERDVDNLDFSVSLVGGGVIAVTNASVDAGYQSVTLTTAGPFAAGSKYLVTVSNPADVYSYIGHYILKNSAYFTGYQTQTAASPVTVSSIEVIDAQTLRLNFSGEILESSFTPVNFSIFWLAAGPVKDALTVTAVTKIDADTYELTTAVQDAAMNYFIAFNGVKDVNGLRLMNASVPNFFGFQLPTASVTLLTPSSTNNETDTNIIISGKNLDVVSQVRVGTEVMNIVSQSATSLTFTLPADFTADLYNITLIDQANNSLVFTSALLVTSPEQVLTVHSDQSKSIPLNVPNDGETPAKLWLLVEDPVGLSSVSSVVVNLSQIGGPSTVEMVKDSGTQPINSQWYTYDVTVPPSVSTTADPYLLPVEVRKGSDKYTGTISIRVTNDIVQSVAPVIDQAYVSPVSVAPDATTPVRISVQVSDADGAHTISSVIADMGALGIGFLTLSPVTELTGSTELETQFYQSEEFTVPLATDEGDYTINIIVSDSSGEQTSTTIPLQVSSSANGPQISSELSYISPRLSIPRDGKTTFDINAFVSDVDGAGTIHDVTANFGSLGISPVKLQKDADAGEGGFTAWYKASGLTVPKTAPLGTHNIVVLATDQAGGVGSLILQIEVTHKDTLGDPPRVVEDRAYTTPRVALNDGETPITLYAFVQDDDDDIESVIVNLGEVGQVGSYTTGTMGAGETTTEPSDGSCPTGSNVLVCMNPSVKEGVNGRWYILPGVTVSPLVSASPNPYQVEVIVTDAGGKVTDGIIPVYVGSGDSITEQQEPPRALAAIPTSDTTVEVLFNKEISASTVNSAGRGFTISSESNINEELPILGATINASGTVVTLSTSNQISGKRYVLSVSNDIKDVVGRSVIEGAANRLNFNGFKLLNRAPILEYIQPTDVNMLELEFRENLKPSSVRTGSSQTDGSSKFGISIYESDDTSKRLSVLSVSLDAPGNVIHIETGSQKADVKYRVNIEGLESYDGTKLPVSINKGFKGYNLAVVQHAAAANFADLNGDGRVDFSDFTIFSSVYGTIYFGQGENVAETAASAADQAGQAIEPDPNATVPVTSVPAGGATQ